MHLIYNLNVSLLSVFKSRLLHALLHQGFQVEHLIKYGEKEWKIDINFMSEKFYLETDYAKTLFLSSCAHSATSKAKVKFPLLFLGFSFEKSKA